MPEYLECCRDNPFRSPQWRWQRATGICEGSQPRPTRKTDGAESYKWIRKAAQFQQELEACNGQADEISLARRRPAMYWAHHAWLDSANPAKWHIEAHLLGRGTDWDVGFAVGVSPEIVQAYEAVFFNVREKLNHKGYILHSVIGPSIQRGLSEREYDLLWKLYAYFNGPHMLDALASKFVNPGWASNPDMVSSTIQDDAIGTLKLKADIAAKTVPVSMNTQVELLHIFTKFVEVERTTDSIGKAQNQILDHVEAMMTTLPFNIGGRDPRQAHATIHRGKIERYAESGVELSFSETMSVAAGHELPYGDMLEQLGAANEHGESLAFPPRPGLEQQEATTNES